MKTESIDEAKKMAREESLTRQDEAIFIIYCNRTKYNYVATDGLIRSWERLIGFYENGRYTAGKSSL
ncbi:DNA-binding protein [Flavobacterium lindanitolerans]|uniref:DNA-binding protein n=1 Tax=Flavobacterium lindanitolerans TaxID=428988 RepID=UPI0023F09DD3|nr:DNA-binding protein [Flavobacterium lindanitolerans]